MLLVELSADPNKENYYTFYTPLHVLASSKCTNYTFLRHRKGSKKSTTTTEPQSTSTNKKLDLSLQQSNISSDSHHGLDESTKRSFMNMNSSFNHTTSNIVYPSEDLITEFMLREMIGLLYEKGADLNRSVKINKYTAMHELDMASVTPLAVAIYFQNLVAIDELMYLGCNPNFAGNFI